MPVFFQHSFSETKILIWKAEELESFFGDELPGFDPAKLPVHPAKRRQFLAGRYLLKCLHPEFDFSQIGRAHV